MTSLCGVEIGFWLAAGLVAYSYVGYGLILFVLTRSRMAAERRARDAQASDPFLPDVTLIVAAYNEAELIDAKIRNCLALDYPRQRLRLLFVTDGSDDGTDQRVSLHPEVRLLHRSVRQGKIAALHRAMAHVDTPFVVYSDANTQLAPGSIRCLMRHYRDERVGAVAGEKRILGDPVETAIGAGEGLYWRYESVLKRWDSALHSVVGAAGELFSIRTELYEEIPLDTIIEDFYLTMRVAERGYRVCYEPEAVALERPSASVREELKRKVRIAAGGLQAVWRLRGLLNPFRHGMLTFQYVSHRVLRWTLAPLALPWILLSNMVLAYGGSGTYAALLAIQVVFYLSAAAGWALESRGTRRRALFVPYYFCVMNYAVYAGLFRLVTGSQSVLWERARRRAGE